jgi:riboflavin synthase alpha subunit
VVEDNSDNFSISVIPLTQEITNIWSLQMWDSVNLEFDIFAKYINKMNKNK